MVAGHVALSDGVILELLVKSAVLWPPLLTGAGAAIGAGLYLLGRYAENLHRVAFHLLPFLWVLAVFAYPILTPPRGEFAVRAAVRWGVVSLLVGLPTYAALNRLVSRLARGRTKLPIIVAGVLVLASWTPIAAWLITRSG